MDPLVGINGRALRTPTSWEPPNKTDWFGWNTPHGPLAIALDAIAACVPDSNKPGFYVMLLRDGSLPQIPLPSEEALRLMKRVGWTERIDMRP